MALPTVEPVASPPARPVRAGTIGLVLSGTAVAVLVAAGLTVLTGARPLAALGLPDPGTLTTVGLPTARVIAEIAMTMTVGSVLLAAFFVAPQRSGYLDVAGYRSLRATAWSASVWAAAAALMVPLTVADTLGRPVADVLDPALLINLVPRLPTATAWTLTTLIALVVLAASRTVLTWGWTVGLLVLCLLGPVPVTVNGHSAAGGSHDIATDSLLLHAVGATLWVGGLVAVLALAASRGPDRAAALATAVPRFSRLALVCWTLLAVTGVVNALTRVPLDPAVLGTAYGALLAGKVAALVALGVLGVLHRRSTVDAAAVGEPRALLRLGGVEVLLMLATIGLAVALGRSAPPDDGAGAPSRTEVQLGYDLTGPPTIDRLFLDWRFDLLFGSAAVLLALVYLLGVRRLRGRGDSWAVGRTAAWLAGCATVLIATSSGIGRYAPAMFSVHMGQHMLLSMLAPILLVLGAPVTMALRALPPAGRNGAPGPREWLLALVHSPAARWLTHPLVTLPLFVGSYYALYFSGLFAAWLPEHWAHAVMKLHFLLVGALFFWPLIGVDPAPRRLLPAARLGVVFASLPFHAFFGVALMSAGVVIGEGWYRGLALPWVPDALADQRLGGGLAWASGELPLVLVITALLVQWSRQDERSARRADRRADNDGDADLTAYNRMLHRLATGEPLVAESDRASGHTNVSTTPDEAVVRPSAGSRERQ